MSLKRFNELTLTKKLFNQDRFTDRQKEWQKYIYKELSDRQDEIDITDGVIKAYN